MRSAGRIGVGVLVASLAVVGAAPAEEPPRKAAEAQGGRVVRKVVKVRAPSWSARRGFLGVELTPLNRELRAFFKAPEDRGVLVRRVEAGSPAAAAGLRVGDVLTAVDGQRVASTHDAIRLVGDKPAGHKARLGLVREGKPQELTAEIEVRERPQVDLSEFVQVYRDQAGEGGEAFDLDFDLDLEAFEPPGPPVPPGARRTFIFRGDEGQREQLEQRLRELEEKLKSLEEKLQGRAGSPRPASAPG